MLLASSDPLNFILASVWTCWLLFCLWLTWYSYIRWVRRPESSLSHEIAVRFQRRGILFGVFIGIVIGLVLGMFVGHFAWPVELVVK